MSDSYHVIYSPEALEDIKDKALIEIADRVAILHRVIYDNKTPDKGLEVIIAKSSYDTKE